MNLCIFLKTGEAPPTRKLCLMEYKPEMYQGGLQYKKNRTTISNNKVKLVSLKYILPVKYKNINYTCMSRSS